eukprot:3988305-Prymnesium_polylepis.1
MSDGAYGRGWNGSLGGDGGVGEAGGNGGERGGAGAKGGHEPSGPDMRTASISSHSFQATRIAVPQIVVSGPEKTVVFCPDGSTTSICVTNGAPWVSKTSIDVAYAGNGKLTSSHSILRSPPKCDHAAKLTLHAGATLAMPVACRAELSVSLHWLEAEARCAHWATGGATGGPGGGFGGEGELGGDGAEGRGAA